MARGGFVRDETKGEPEEVGNKEEPSLREKLRREVQEMEVEFR